MRRLLAICAAMLALAPGGAAAHDFWLYPSTHQLDKPGDVAVRVKLGQPNEVSELERRVEHIKRFEAQGPDGYVKATGDRGKVPAGSLKLPVDGIYAVIYQSAHSLVQLDPRKFEKYLAEEGLLDIIADRDKRGESERPGRDSFARYAKALVRVGSASDGYDRKLGMPAEIVALSDPFTGGGGTLEFEFWYLGERRAGAFVELFKVDENNITAMGHATTDREGRVSFATPGVGRWMVAATTMRRAAPPLEGDWESFWASLSFEVATVDAPARARGGCSKGAFAGALGVGAVLLAGWWWSKRRKPAPKAKR